MQLNVSEGFFFSPLEMVKHKVALRTFGAFILGDNLKLRYGPEQPVPAESALGVGLNDLHQCLPASTL